MKRTFLLFCAIISCLLSLHAQSRIYQTINSNWSFYKGEIKDFPQSDADIKWENVSLPHSWNAMDVNDDEPGYYRGIGWYKKQLYIPSSWKNKEVYIFFEGASQVTEVYINGQIIGKHTGGYNFFSFPVSKYLKSDTGKVAINEIVVKVDNSHNDDIPPLSADFTFFGGIYRDVELVVSNPVHFDMDNYASNGVFITTPKVSENLASVNITGAFVNNSEKNRNILVQTQVFDPEGKLILKKETKAKAAINQKIQFQHSLTDIANPKLWSPETPHLYKVVSTITDAASKEVLDEVINPLGFRWFSFDAQNSFLLNGKPCKLIGASRHQDFKDMANALPNAMHVRDVELLKEMGGNFLRVAHYPQDPAILETCDRLGILTSVEIPVVNQITETTAFTQNCMNMQTEMIRQNFNHPSVIMWAYMNEVLLRLKYDKGSEKQETYFKNLTRLAEQLDSLTRKEDPSRYTMIAHHGNFDLYHKTKLTIIPDVVGWNLYSGWYSGEFGGFARFLDRHHKDLPNKPLIVTEYGADADPRLHSLKPVRFDKSNEYALTFHKVYLKEILDRPFVAGAAIWNLADFNSETRAEAMPHINNKGILTIDRRAKNMYLFYQANLKKEPFLKIGSDLWKLRSGNADSANTKVCIQPVEILTNQPKVLLKLNGQLIGEANTQLGIAIFNVPFVHGINKLEAIAENNGSILTDITEIDFKIIPKGLSSKDIPFTEVNISLGDNRYFIDEKLHQVWIPEKPYQPGSYGFIGGQVFFMSPTEKVRYGSDKNILGTDYDPIYETQRTGLEKFKLDAPDGVYEVTLHFAELLSDKKREELIYNLTGGNVRKENLSNRVFDVLINNSPVLENLGNNNYLVPEHAVAFRFKVSAKNGEGITISFVPKNGQPILNGLQVRKIF